MNSSMVMLVVQQGGIGPVEGERYSKLVVVLEEGQMDYKL